VERAVVGAPVPRAPLPFVRVRF